MNVRKSKRKKGLKARLAQEGIKGVKKKEGSNRY